MHEQIWSYIDGLLPQKHAVVQINALYHMMRDYPRRGGKMLRGSLALLTAQAYGSTLDRALPLAAALELFQNWVLIHDDIADNSEERRGLPALHQLHGVPLALNAGDALHVYMWQAVFDCPVDVRAEFLHMIHRTAEGQHIDLSWVAEQTWDISVNRYLEMVQLKTAYYTIIGPLQMGMKTAGHQAHPLLTEAGLCLGSAFQIRDDVLNLTAEFDTYGKEIGGDLWEGKRTLITTDFLTQASDDQRAFFLKAMNQPRSDKRAEDMETLHTWLLESGATHRAMEVAQTEAERGLTLLSEVFADAPHRHPVERILSVVRNLVTRSF
ncbi:MAG: polyprenyl synthetase family protein [Deinococcaceae bacterium]